MNIFQAVRGSARALSGVVCGVLAVGIGGAVLLHGEQRPAVPTVARAEIAGLSSAPTVASREVSPAWSGARLVRIGDVNVQGSLSGMSPFSGEGADNRSFQCLSTALYYEARGEGVDGMAAVAQVILNRARHPAFPHSVCGVVYQARQFSFVGAGLRAPYGPLWTEAREIAQRALDGYVMARVGTATHFHALRVRPGWPGMTRVATIGQHVFYAYAGSRGRAESFRAIPDLDGDAPAPGRREYARLQRPEVSTNAAVADDATTTAGAPDLTVPTDTPLAAAAPVA